MTYPLTPARCSIATANDYLAKTDKVKGFNHIMKDCSNAASPPIPETLTVLDGNAYFYLLKDLPANFGQICSKAFDLLGKTGVVIFSTGQYCPDSINSVERRCRGCGEKLVLKGDATKRPADWKSFLANENNKFQFIRLLPKTWCSDKYAARLHEEDLSSSVMVEHTFSHPLMEAK